MATDGEPESTRSIAVFAEFLSDSFDHHAEFSVFVAKLFELGFDALAASFGAIALWLIALWLIALWLIALWLILGSTCTRWLI